jgi:alkanesulfonate monooxygenase SsuD/methylene tetrahydromethanopterin reductase-like flavin-dependent oxidoreductase (luciferase family)
MKVSLFSVSDYYPDVQADPQAFLMDQVALAQIAEGLGFHAYFNAEHHFHEYGLIPDPAILFGAIAMKTSKILIGPAASILTFHHPLRAAEQWAMVDQYSKGRLILGVGSGYLMHEFDGFSMSPAQKRQRFDEILEIMEIALTGKKFSYRGKFYSHKNVRLNLTPYKGRKLHLAVAILSEIASYYMGKRDYSIMTIPYATVTNVDELKPIYANFRRGWSESKQEGPGEVITAVHCHVSETPAQNKLGRDHLTKYIVSRLYAQQVSYDECIDRGVIACGSPDEVTASLQRMIDTGVDHLMLICNYGGMELSEIERSLKLISSEVMPRLRTAPENVLKGAVS